MAKYRVTLTTVVSYTREVEADDDEQAVEAAYEDRPREVWGRDHEQTQAMDLNDEWQLREPDVEEINEA